MSTTRQASPAATGAATGAPSGPLYVFGDSLSDPGNLFAQAAGLVAPEVLADYTGDGGRLSDGPVWVEQVAPLVEGGVAGNYAVAGAQAAGTLTLGELIGERYADPFVVPADDPRLAWGINLGAQVDRFLADTAGRDMGDATAFLLIGNNDFLTLADGANPLTVIEDAVSATILAAAELAIDGGVGTVVISTLPAIPFFPLSLDLSPEDQQLAAFASALYAQSLAESVAWLEAGLEPSGVEVRLLDLAPLTAAIAEDPVSFGIVAPQGLTLSSGDPDLAGFDADQVAFWDDVHPSEAIHGVIAAFNAFALSSTPVALGAGDDALAASEAADLVLALEGDDALDLGGGLDLAFGGSGNDALSGGAKGDLLSGGSDADRLSGGDGKDVLDGDAGSDVLMGGNGNDLLIDGRGSDRLQGDGGDDAFVWTEAGLIGGVNGKNRDMIDGGSGRDRLFVVLSEESYDLWEEALEGGRPDEALARLGIEASGIEKIVVLEGREGLAALSDERWYGQADIWGLI